MKKILFIISVPFLLVFLTSQASFSQVYKWVDGKGVAHFTDDITQVPGEFQAKAERSKRSRKRKTQNLRGISTYEKRGLLQGPIGRGEDYWKGALRSGEKTKRTTR